MHAARRDGPSRTACSRDRGDRARRSSATGSASASVHRQFVLPIALHKAIGSRALHRRRSERVLDRARPAASRSARRSRSSPNGARPSHRRDRVSPADISPARLPRAATRCRALVRDRRPGAPRLAQRRHRRSSTGDLRDRSALGAAVAGVDVVYHIAAIYRQAGSADEHLSRGQRDGGRRAHRSGRRAPASAASCTAAPSACTATSSIRRPTKTRRSSRATSIRRRSSKASGWRARPAARLGIEVTIARPTGIYGPGDRRLLKLFRGVARGRWFRPSAAAKSTTI